MRQKMTIAIVCLMLHAYLGLTCFGSDVSTALNFSGHLTEGGYDADGVFNFTFKLLDDALSGNQVGSSIAVPDVNTIGGNYSAEIDFGNVFNGQELWLSTEVLKQGDSSPTALSPRQKLMAVPYSLFSLKSGAPWKTNPSNNIYFNSGKVGIGKTDPAFDLDVNGTLKLKSGNPVSDISNDATMSNNSPSKLATQQAIKQYVDSKMSTIVGLVPVGSIIAWNKSMPNTPTLPDMYAECNGQVINDTGSPYNGLILPNLNGENRFLRGAPTSSGTGGSDTHTHTVMAPNQGSIAVSSGSAGIWEKYPNTPQTSSATSTLPLYYNVVWIMRIK